MPYKDPEKQRECNRKAVSKYQSKPENKEKAKVYWKKYKAENGDGIRENARLKQQQRRVEEPEKVREEKKRDYHKNKHKHKIKVAEYGAQWHEKNRSKRLDYAREKQRAFKAKVVEYLGGHCVVCGLVDELPVYDAHHLDPSQKEFNITTRRAEADWDVVKAELDKCVLLCANCHRKVHAGFISFENSS